MATRLVIKSNNITNDENTLLLEGVSLSNNICFYNAKQWNITQHNSLLVPTKKWIFRMKFGFSMGHQRPMAIFTSILLTKSETPWSELNSALQSTS